MILILILLISGVMGLGLSVPASAASVTNPEKSDCDMVKDDIAAAGNDLTAHIRWPTYVTTDVGAYTFLDACGLNTDFSEHFGAGGNTNGTEQTPPNNSDTNNDCTTILGISCDDKDGVWKILNIILQIMTAGVGVAGTIGLVVSGIQYTTARDREDQVKKAKSRAFNVVIGLIVWGVMWLVLQWLLPGGVL